MNSLTPSGRARASAGRARPRASAPRRCREGGRRAAARAEPRAAPEPEAARPRPAAAAARARARARGRRRGCRPRSRTPGAAAGGQEEDRRVSQASQRERERARRGAVEPLDVVDRENKRTPGSENLHGVPQGDAERARIHRTSRRRLYEERDLERAAPRRGQCRHDELERVLEQVAQPRVSKALLRLGRPRREDAEAALARGLDPSEPERRLPDPRFALEHECRRSCTRAVEEDGQGTELLVPADDLASYHLATIVTGRGAEI